MIGRTIAFCTALLAGASAIELPKDRTSDSDMTIKDLNNEIDSSIDHIQMTEDLSRINLEKNEAFHDWLMDTGRK
jgi:hypothetical protein